MPLSADLAAALVCPESKQPLVYFKDEDFLFCPASKLKYRVEDGIAVLLIEEAERVEGAEAERLVAEAGKRGLLPA
jgi:uncharacterized protein YbaR (Trm112 family)